MADPQAYWYDETDAAAVEVLTALRLFRAADHAMRRRTQDSMDMGESDLLALRYLARMRSREQRAATVGELTAYLGLSTSSVTTLLDRLTVSGHLVRRPHPTDRRALTVELTEAAEAEVRATLGAMHQRMMAAARKLDAEQADLVRTFFLDVVEAMDGVHPDEREPDLSEAQ